MGCNNCRPPFIAKATSNEISWQGDAFSTLDVCIGDSLTYVGNIILTKIKDILAGKGIILDDLTISDCEYIEDLLGLQEKNLLNILKVYKQAICEIKEDIDTLRIEYEDYGSVENYSLQCITVGDPESCEPPKFKELIQAIIDKLCAIQTQINGVAATLLEVAEEGAGNLLGSGAVTSCGGNGYTVSGIGASTVVKFQALVPPNCPIIYRGSLSFFDVNGIGLPNSPYCGWYLCNGSNGTPTSSSLPQNVAGTIQYIIRFT